MKQHEKQTLGPNSGDVREERKIREKEHQHKVLSNLYFNIYNHNILTLANVQIHYACILLNITSLNKE